MKRLRLTLTGCICLLFSGLLLESAAAREERELLTRHHFAGASAVHAGDEAATFKEVTRLPETRAFVAHIIDTNLPRLGRLLAGRSGAEGGDFARALRPLLQDLPRYESASEWRLNPDGSSEVVFGIRLPDERAAVWNEQLKLLTVEMGAPETRDIRAEDVRGWETAGDAESHRFRLVSAREWLVIGCGRGQLELHDGFVKRIHENGRPVVEAEGHWLRSEVNWPLLQSRLRLSPGLLKAARTDLTLGRRDEYVRTEIRAVYPEPLDWKAGPWRIPTETIREPLISFLAARNVAALLNTVPEWNRLAIQPHTNQFFAWAQSVVHFQTYGAMPVSDGAEALKTLSTNLPEVFGERMEKRNLGRLRWNEERREIQWQGLPIIAPFVRAVSEPAGDFLTGGFFPPAPGLKPAPPELLEQVVGRDDLIFYHWEITEARLEQWRMLGSLLPMFPTSLAGRDLRQPIPKPHPVGQQWLNAIAPKLGNTITEVTLTGPNEVHLVRRSHIGFAALELVSIVNWLAGYEEGPRPRSAPGNGAAPSPAGETERREP